MVRYSYILMDRLPAFSSTSDLRRLLDVIRGAGYEGVELNMAEPLQLDVETINECVQQSGLRVVSFLSGEAYYDGLCLSSPDAAIRKRTVERLKRYVETAAFFQSIFVVGLLQGLRSDEPDPETANARIVECLKEVSAAAVQKGVEFVIEPVNHLQVGFNNSVAEVRELIKRVNSPALRPMVDTIHMNIEEASITQPILDCGSTLRHVHLCESNGGRMGTGHVDFVGVMRALHEVAYEGFASVKVYRQLSLEEATRSSIAFLRSLPVPAQNVV
jgi:sugar phosphate isomerase/epimerase